MAGAFLGLLQKSKGKHPEKSAPPNDAREGSKYSKTTDVESSSGPEDYDDGEDAVNDDGKDHEKDHEGDAAFDSFADHAGIPDERRASAKAALRRYVKACSRSSSPDMDSDDK